MVTSLRQHSFSPASASALLVDESMQWWNGQQLSKSDYDESTALWKPLVTDRGRVAGKALKYSILSLHWGFIAWGIVTIVTWTFRDYLLTCDELACSLTKWWPMMFILLVPLLELERRCLKVVIVPFVRSFKQADEYPKLLGHQLRFGPYMFLRRITSFVSHADVLTSATTTVVAIATHRLNPHFWMLTEGISVWMLTLGWWAVCAQFLYGLFCFIPCRKVGLPGDSCFFSAWRVPYSRDVITLRDRIVPAEYNLDQTYESDFSDGVFVKVARVCRMIAVTELNTNYDRVKAKENLQKQFIQGSMLYKRQQGSLWQIWLFLILQTGVQVVIESKWYYTLIYDSKQEIPWFAVASITAGLLNGVYQLHVEWEQAVSIRTNLRDYDLEYLYIQHIKAWIQKVNRKEELMMPEDRIPAIADKLWSYLMGEQEVTEQDEYLKILVDSGDGKNKFPKDRQAANDALKAKERSKCMFVLNVISLVIFGGMLVYSASKLGMMMLMGHCSAQVCDKLDDTSLVIFSGMLVYSAYLVVMVWCSFLFVL